MRAWPKTEISPAVSRIRLQTALIRVVLPAPFGPSSPKNAPAGTSRSSDVEAEGAVVVALGQPADLERGYIRVAHAGFPSGPHLMRLTRQSRMRSRSAERRQASKKSPWASDTSSAPIESRTSLPPSES